MQVVAQMRREMFVHFAAICGKWLMRFSAVLLAGGKSSRMGCDKAALVVDGEPLWRRQLAVLRATGAAEVFISGKADGPYAGAGVEIVGDVRSESGPLGGIAAALRRCGEEWLLVLAVDMPAMTADFLCSLTDAARKGTGIVPVTDRIQPLAALYPCAALETAETFLRDGRRKMESFVDELLARSLVRRLDVPATQRPLFTNWNTPGDIAGGQLAPK